MMLELVDIEVSFNHVPFLRNVNLSVERGAIVTLVGPSGSGKSTLLRVICGLVAPSAGRVVIDGRDVTTLAPHRRPVGMVFQDNQLFPHLSVADNVGYALRIARVNRATRLEVVHEMLQLVGLAGFEDRRVDRLSGGEAKRVAVARSLAASPAVLLLDEPLAGLDAALHDRMLDDLADQLVERATTVVHVTHDATEANRLGSRIVDIRDIAIS
jgi:ABC-type Fe3+/spermidine/putrescine transport system ATPase subunit